MLTESSLIVTSKLVKRLISLLLIIAVFVVGWNIFKKLPTPGEVTIPYPIQKYSYLPLSNLTMNSNMNSNINDTEISIPSETLSTSFSDKNIILINTLNDYPKRVFLYKVSRPVENFGSADKANQVANQLNFTNAKKSFANNSILWEEPGKTLRFDRTNLSFEYHSTEFLESQFLESKTPSKENTPTSFLASIKLDTKDYDLSNFDTKTEKGTTLISVYKTVDYLAVSENSLKEIKKASLIADKARVYTPNEYGTYFYAKFNSLESIQIENLAELYFEPFEIISNPLKNNTTTSTNSSGTSGNLDKVGVYEIISIQQAFQNLTQNVYIIHKTTNPSLKTYKVDGQKSEFAYLLSIRTGIGTEKENLHLHPVYIFRGEGFEIYIDALPKSIPN